MAQGNREFGCLFFHTGNLPKIFKICLYAGNLPSAQGKRFENKRI